MFKLYKNFWFDFAIAISALVLGVIMLPPFGIGEFALNVLLAATLTVYFFVYLLDKLKRTKGSIFLLTVMECVVYLFIIVDLVVQQFKLADVLSVCRAIGLILWVRGVSSAIGMYIRLASSKSRKSNLPDFLTRILMISVGSYLFAHPLLNDVILNWAMCILFFVSSLCFGGLAILFFPIKKQNGKE